MFDSISHTRRSDLPEYQDEEKEICKYCGINNHSVSWQVQPGVHYRDCVWYNKYKLSGYRMKEKKSKSILKRVYRFLCFLIFDYRDIVTSNKRLN